MSSRERWAGAAPTALVVALVLLPAVVVAIVFEDAAGVLGFGALVLLGAAALHGLRARALPGTPAQNLGRIVLVGAVVLGVLVVLAAAFVTWLSAGLCGSACDDRPWRENGGLVVLGFLAALAAILAGGAWLWARIGRDGIAPAAAGGARTARPLTLLPAAAVGLVALVEAIATPGDPRRPVPVGTARVLWSPCQAAGPADRGCGTAEGLRTASSGGALVATWWSSDALLGSVVRGDGRVRVVRIATVPRGAGGRPGGTAVAAAPGGGFLVAWVAGDALRLARVAEDGAVRAVGGSRPGPTSARTAAGDPRPAARERALTATADGYVAFAVGRIGDGGGPGAVGGAGSRTALRVLGLDDALGPRGRWRTVRGAVPFALAGAERTTDGRAAVSLGTGAVRSTVSVAADGGGVPRVERDRLVVPGPGGARIVGLPGPRDLPVGRVRPTLDSAVRDAGGAVRSSWTTSAPRADGIPARVRQQWVLGPGPGTPDRPLADGLLESRLVTTSRGVALLGLRPTGPRRSDDVEVVLVRGGR